MNFFKQAFEIMTGTYKPPGSTTSASNSYNNYFGSSNINMTKDQLSNFDTMLGATGLTKPAGIDNLLQDFDAADTNHDGKLTSAEVQAYLLSKGFISNTPTAAPTPITTSNLSGNTGNLPSSQALMSAINALMQ